MFIQIEHRAKYEKCIHDVESGAATSIPPSLLLLLFQIAERDPEVYNGIHFLSLSFPPLSLPLTPSPSPSLLLTPL